MDCSPLLRDPPLPPAEKWTTFCFFFQIRFFFTESVHLLTNKNKNEVDLWIISLDPLPPPKWTVVQLLFVLIFCTTKIWKSFMGVGGGAKTKLLDFLYFFHNGKISEKVYKNISKCTKNYVKIKFFHTFG